MKLDIYLFNFLEAELAFVRCSLPSAIQIRQRHLEHACCLWTFATLYINLDGDNVLAFMKKRQKSLLINDLGE